MDVRRRVRQNYEMSEEDENNKWHTQGVPGARSARVGSTHWKKGRHKMSFRSVFWFIMQAEFKNKADCCLSSDRASEQEKAGPPRVYFAWRDACRSCHTRAAHILKLRITFCKETAEIGRPHFSHSTSTHSNTPAWRRPIEDWDVNIAHLFFITEITEITTTYWVNWRLTTKSQ